MKVTIRLLLIIIGVSVAGGCSGKIYTGSLQANKNGSKTVTVENGVIDGQFEGVLFYPPALFHEVYVTTTRVEKKTKRPENNRRTEEGRGPSERSRETTEVIVGRAADNTCLPQVLTNLAVHPNYDNPLHIRYDAGFLENNEFGVKLKDGMLESVNSKSQPDRGETLVNLAKALPLFEAIAGTDDPGVKCNDGKTLQALLLFKPKETYEDLEKRICNTLPEKFCGSPGRK